MQRTEIQVNKAFDLQAPDSMTVPGYDWPSPFVPPLEPGYRFRKGLLSDVFAWFKEGTDEGLYLCGPTGSGKSSVLRQVAARLNQPVQRLTGNARTELSDMVGHHTVVDGDMMFVDGPLTAAMRHGHLFLFDELDLVDPGVLAGLNGVVEGDPLTIPENGGEVVHPAEGFCFAATGNTGGGGDETGLYQGTVRQNTAFMDRFWIVYVDYPPAEHEKEILAELVPALPTGVHDYLVDTAHEVRRLFIGSEGGEATMEIPMSTRTLVRWGRLAAFHQGVAKNGVSPLHHALDRAIGFRAAPETREAMHEIVQRVSGESWGVVNG